MCTNETVEKQFILTNKTLFKSMQAFPTHCPHSPSVFAQMARCELTSCGCERITAKEPCLRVLRACGGVLGTPNMRTKLGSQEHAFLELVLSCTNKTKLTYILESY